MKKFLILVLSLALYACSTTHSMPQPTLFKAEPLSRYGNPPEYAINGHIYHVLHSAKGYDAVGYASWYGPKFQGKLTSTRERYNMYAMSAASTVLPLPTYVRVTNLSNGRSIIVRVNDRGPFKRHRILDLSYAAARKLGYARKGTTLVHVVALTHPFSGTQTM